MAALVCVHSLAVTGDADALRSVVSAILSDTGIPSRRLADACVFASLHVRGEAHPHAALEVAAALHVRMLVCSRDV